MDAGIGRSVDTEGETTAWLGEPGQTQIEARGVLSAQRMKTADIMEALSDAKEPLRTFLVKHGKERERR